MPPPPLAAASPTPDDLPRAFHDALDAQRMRVADFTNPFRIACTAAWLALTFLDPAASRSPRKETASQRQAGPAMPTAYEAPVQK